MGLFTNRCVNPECRHRVRKGSQFCPKCGDGAPRGLASCGSCGAEVSSTSKFCWKCGMDLAEVAKPLLADDRWVRRPGEFAVLVADHDIKGRLAKPLIIEHGTRAMLFQSGKFKGEIGEGRYNMDGFFKKLVHLSSDLAASIVLCDAGDVTIDLENGDLWTSDTTEVGTTARLVLRIQDPDAMYVNMFKGHGCIGLDEIELQLAGEVQMLLSGIVAEHESEELFTNVEARNVIEARLRDTIGVTLSRLGLELVQLRFISFYGEAYEKIRAERGDLATAEGHAAVREGWTKLHMKLRDTESQDKMDECKSAADLKDFIVQTAHEMKLKDAIRDNEIDSLVERFEYDRNRENVLRRIEIQAIEDESDRDKAWLDLLAQERRIDETHKHDLDRKLTDAKSEHEITTIRIEVSGLEHAENLRQRHEEHIQDMIEARDGMDNLQRVTQIKQDQADREQQREAATLEARSKATAEALLSIMDGPAADRIVRIEELRNQQNMSPEQILAIAANASPQAANALAAKYQAEGQIQAGMVDQLRQQIDQQRDMSDKHADRLERVMQSAMEQMGHVAGTRARPVDPKQTVVAGAGGPAPIVINTPTSQPTVSCKHCNAQLETGGAFCPACGKKQ